MQNFVVCYGMTETSPVTFQGFCSDSLDIKTSTVGFPSNHQEMAIMDTEGRVGDVVSFCGRPFYSYNV